jgi:hypothetical protein
MEKKEKCGMERERERVEGGERPERKGVGWFRVLSRLCTPLSNKAYLGFYWGSP